MTESESENRGKSLRIACVIHSLDGGGAERVMSGLVGSLQERGHGVSLICLDDGTGDRYLVHPDVRRIHLNVMSDGRTNSGPLHRLKALRTAIHSEHPDVVLSFCDATNLLVLLATRWLRVPVIVSERSDPRRQRLSWVKERLRTMLYRRATHVVAQTNEVAQYLSRRLHREVSVIGSAIKSRSTLVVGGRDPDDSRKVIVTVGRCESEKGWDRLIDAVARLPSELPWTLKLVGDGSLRSKMESHATQKALDHRIEWVGWSQNVEKHLCGADLFVLPSRYEGFPSALLEAMSVGLPVIAFDASPGIRACITNGHDGILVTNEAPHDITELRDAIERVLSNAPVRKHLSENALKSARKHGWEDMVERFEGVLLKAACR